MSVYFCPTCNTELDEKLVHFVERKPRHSVWILNAAPAGSGRVGSTERVHDVVLRPEATRDILLQEVSRSLRETHPEQAPHLIRALEKLLAPTDPPEVAADREVKLMWFESFRETYLPLSSDVAGYRISEVIVDEAAEISPEAMAALLRCDCVLEMASGVPRPDCPRCHGTGRREP